jgi:hypothetical protein
MNNLEILIEDGGDVSLGPEDGYAFVAIASDVEDVVALLVRKEGETLTALLRRLDRAVGKFFENGEVIDEVYDL